MRAEAAVLLLNHGSISLPDEDAAERRLIEMDIDYPEHIVERVNAALAELRRTRRRQLMWWM